MPADPPPLEAGYESVCPACGDPIFPGDQLAQLEGSYVHAECADAS